MSGSKRVSDSTSSSNSEIRIAVSEFSAVATFLVSEAASYVTGSQIRCDGGLIRSV